MSSRLFIKATLITLLIPGTATLLIPYFLLTRSHIVEWLGISAFALLPILSGGAGFVVLLHCIWEFAVRGKGTLAPIDPPQVLVVQGLYRYTRNPMYIAVIVILLSEALLFESVSMILYAALVLVCFHLFVILYEEPHLRSRFGESYEEYSRTIPRWRINVPGFVPKAGPDAQQPR